MHKGLKDDNDELKASCWLIFPAMQCFGMKETSLKLKHGQNASVGWSLEEIVNFFPPIHTSERHDVGKLSHTAYMSISFIN